MKEFFDLLKKGRFRAIFLDPTDNGFLQFFRYLFVGGYAMAFTVKSRRARSSFTDPTNAT